MIAGVVGLHIWALHVAGQNNPTGLDIKQPSDSVPMHPYATAKDVVGIFAFLILFAWFAFFIPDYLGHADNYVEANPLVTPPEIVPEWYLLPFYAMLRSIPQKLIGVLVLFGALATLVFAPWLDTSKVRSMRFRPMLKPFFWLLVLTCLMLGYLGAKRPDAIWNLGGIEISLVWPARLGTLYYYAYFWLILPIVGLIETPKPVPDSIAKPVLKAAE